MEMCVCLFSIIYRPFAWREPDYFSLFFNLISRSTLPICSLTSSLKADVPGWPGRNSRVSREQVAGGRAENETNVQRAALVSAINSM